MFQRYAPPARRVIYFAREAALHAGSSNIDSSHLLCGLLVEPSTRANKLFELGARFPEETARLRALKKFSQPRDIPRSRDGKKILAGATEEANRLDHYRIDTDHLLLALLRAETTTGSAMLHKVGFRHEEVRKIAANTADSRDHDEPVPALWRLQKPVRRVGRVAGPLYLLGVLVLIHLLTEGGYGFKR